MKEKHVKGNEQKCKLRYTVCFHIKKTARVMYLREFFYFSLFFFMTRIHVWNSGCNKTKSGKKFSRVGSWVFRFVGFGVTRATTDSTLTEAVMGKNVECGWKVFLNKLTQSFFVKE